MMDKPRKKSHLTLLAFLSLIPLLMAETLDITRGAIPIEFNMPYKGKASLGLYTPEGQLKRVLFQAVDFKKGDYTVLWDGLDLWGKMVPAGTQLKVKVFTHEGIRAFYEFPLGYGDWYENDPPWRTAVTFPDRKDGFILNSSGRKAAYRKDGVTYRITKDMFDKEGNLTDRAKKADYRHLSGDRVSIQPGEATLRGGWMSDHNAPKSIEVVGDRVFVAASGAEAGDPFIALNMEGRKIWGKGGAMGGAGPTRMWDLDGRDMILQEKSRLSRFDSLTFEKKHLLKIPGNPQNVDVAGDRIHVIQKPRSAIKVVHFHRSLAKVPIDFYNTTPQHVSQVTPHMKISARDNFKGVFTGGSHALQGVSAGYRSGFGYIVCPLKSPAKIGTIAVGKYSKMGLKMEIHVLKTGLKYEHEVHSPLINEKDRGSAADILSQGGDDFELDEGGDEEDAFDIDLDMSEFSGNWELFGSTQGDRHMNWIIGEKGAIETAAVMFKFVLPKGKKRGDVFLKHCSMWENRIEMPNEPQFSVLPGTTKKGPPRTGEGWSFKTIEKPEPLRPFHMMLDYGEEITFDGFALKQPKNYDWSIEAFRGEGEPDMADDSQWKEIHRQNVGPSHRTGYGAVKANLVHFASLTARETTRALRLTYRSGMGRGKDNVNWIKAQPHLVHCQSFAPLMLKDETVEVAEERDTYMYVQYDVNNGEELSREQTFNANFHQFDVDDEGRIFATLNNGRHDRPLIQTKLVDGEWQNRPFKPKDGPETYTAVRSSRGKLLVSGGHRIFVMDPKTLKTLHTLGWDQDYKPGPFHRNMVGRGGTDMAMDANNKVWFIESRHQPKRVARFNLKGECEWHVTGGPGYGGYGTGYLDPDMENFFTNGLHYKVDFSAGKSDLVGFADTPYAPTSPIVIDTTFWYTNGGRVVYHENGHKYAVGYNCEFVAILRDGVMQPCMVSGSATSKKGPSPFFTRKPWKEEWVGTDFQGKKFFWNDRNADGQFQKEEVILYKPDAEKGIHNIRWGAYWGQKMGNDLAINTGAGRLAPTSFTSDGVPMYDMENFQPFEHRKLPSYNGLQAWGSRACSNPNPHNGASIVLNTGHRIMAGQPYLWDNKLKAVGGTPDTRNGGDGFQPEVPGQKIEHPMGYAGAGTTKSDVKEVGVVIGNLGTWSIESAHDRILLTNILDGSEGGFSTDLPGIRGTEVTHRSFEGEAYFGHFVTSKDGKHYIVGGKNYHALIRLEGLDDIKVVEKPLRVSTASVAKNERLREIMVTEWRETLQAQKEGRWLVAQTVDERLGQKSPRLDGSVEAWGGLKKMHAIDAQLKQSDRKPRYFFDVARSKKGLHLAYAGQNFQGSENDSIEGIFKTGFAFDFRWRSDTRAKKVPKAVEGDRRIVFGKINGKWTAVFHDYVVPGAKESEGRSYSSPVVTTRVDVVRELKPEEYQLKVLEDALMIGEVDTTADMALEDQSKKGVRPWWSAEVVLPWKLLGVSRPMMFDVGVMAANSGGSALEERRYWATPQAIKTTSDLGAEAAISPQAWGMMYFTEPEDPKGRLNEKWRHK